MFTVCRKGLLHLCHLRIGPNFSTRKFSNIFLQIQPKKRCVLDKIPLNRLQKMSTLSLSNSLVYDYVCHLNATYDNAEKILSSTDSEEVQKQAAARKTTIELQHVCHLFNVYQSNQKHKEDLQVMIKDLTKEENEMKEMITTEMREITENMQEVESEILYHLVPAEPGDMNDVMIELTAGVGGQEAMLFTKEMFEMYQNYVQYKGWVLDVISVDETVLGGIRKASAMINGEEVYKYLKYEGGVHRVQRNPKTEKSGRMHTSTMSVAILPQPTEVEISIEPQDIKITTFRASGAGGQHVNTTESAIRIQHIPSGEVVECQRERSQIRNKAIALQILRSRLYEKEVSRQIEKQQASRKIQVGSASRNEKIRTYNYAQDRITDHRLSGTNMHHMEDFLSGTDKLDEMIEKLIEASKLERLLEKLEEYKSFSGAKS